MKNKNVCLALGSPKYAPVRTMLGRARKKHKGASFSWVLIEHAKIGLIERGFARKREKTAFGL